MVVHLHGDERVPLPPSSPIQTTMNMKHPRFLPIAALIALVPSLMPSARSLPSQRATREDQAVAVAAALLAAKTAPIAPGVKQSAAQRAEPKQVAPESMSVLVRRIVASGHPESIEVLGSAAAPELRRMADQYDLVRLINFDAANAVALLVAYLPADALGYLIDLQVREPQNYEALVRLKERLPWGLIRVGTINPTLRSALLPLVEFTVSNEGLDLEQRLQTALRAYQIGIKSDAGEALIRSHPGRAHHHEKYTPGEVWSEHRVHELIYPVGTPLPADLSLAFAVELLTERPTIALLEELAALNLTDIQHHLFRAVNKMIRVTNLSADERSERLEWFLGSTHQSLRISAFGVALDLLAPTAPHLSDEDLTELVVQMYDYVAKHVDDRKMMLPNLVRRQLDVRPGLSGEHVGRIFRAAVTNPTASIAYYWASSRRGFKYVPHAFAYAEEALALPNFATLGIDPLRPLATAIQMMDASSPERAAWTLRYLGLGGADSLGERLDEISLEHNRGNVPGANKLKRDALFDALPVADGIEAARWLTTLEPEYAKLAFEASEDWEDAASRLRALAGDSHEPVRMRLFALGSLVARNEATETEREDLVAQLAMLSLDPVKAPDVEWLDESSTGSSDQARLSWARITLELLRNKSVPVRVASELKMLIGVNEDPEAKAVVAQVIAAAVNRKRGSEETLRFGDIAYFALEWMERHPDLVAPELVQAWFLGGSFRHKCIDVIVASGDSQLVEMLAEKTLVDLESANSTNGRKGAAATLFRLPGDAYIERLLAFAFRIQDKQFASYVETAVAERLRLRETAQRWSVLASGGESVAMARIKVIAMLDSSDEETRVQAVYALGTLGAIEAVPRLLELVSSDDDRIKTAAIETLTVLRKAASKE